MMDWRFLGNGGVNAAEAVVAAEGEQEDVDGLAEHPIDAAGAAGGGFAAEAGVDDRATGRRGRRQARKGVEFVLEERRVGIGGGALETIAGGAGCRRNTRGS